MNENQKPPTQSASIININDRVKYTDINLPRLGTIVSIGRTPRGGDCMVRWDGYSFVSEECISNLKSQAVGDIR